jgi:hypothetical protein
MILQTFSGEVSEVSEDIFQVRNRRDVLNYDTWSGALSAFCVRNLSARKCGSSTFREPRNLFEIRSKSRVYGCLDVFGRWLPLARLARLSEVMVLGITSPCKPLKTLVFLSKARLARLFPPMLTCTHACVRMRVIKNHAYRNGLKITSPNLANLASGFSSADARLSSAINLPATLPHVASSQPRCSTSRTSRSTRQWANGCPTTRLPEWHSNVGSHQKTLGTPSPTPQTLGCRNSRASRHSFYVLSECRKGNMISNEKQGLGNLFAESDYSCNIAIEAEAESCRSHASSPDLLHHSASDPLRSIPESQATEHEGPSTCTVQLGFRFEERVESSDPSGTQSIEERQFGVCVEASLDILESKSPALPASLIFRPSSLVQLLNSTGLGEVISERQLYRQRKRAPKINSGTKRVDLLAYCAWLHLQRHKPKAQVRRRRVGNLEVITLGELRRILKAQNHRCALTNEILTAENLSLDHIVPLAAGGDFSASNCQLVTAEVNRAKNTMRMSDFIELCKKVALHAERHSVLKNSTQGDPKHE